MKAFALVSAFVLVGGALATGGDSVAGSYLLQGSSSYARILLRGDGTFSYASNVQGAVTGTSGKFTIVEHRITLIAKHEFPAQGVKSLAGDALDDALVIDGGRYVKSGSQTAPTVVRPIDLVGTWTLPDNKSIRIVFRDNQTFEFSGMAASSRGKYSVQGRQLTLIWSEVDGEPVAVGTMRKVIAVRDDGTFNIDTYHYVKS